MKTTLKTKIQLHSAIVFLQFKKQVGRPDIQDFLNGNEFRDELVNKRVRAYLFEQGFLDANGGMTKYGRSVRENGEVWVYEKGKYRGWYSDEVYFLGNSVFCLERVEPKSSTDGLSHLPRLASETLVYIIKRDGGQASGDYVWLDFENGGIATGEPEKYGGELFFEWTWDGLVKSEFRYRGNIVSDGSKTNIELPESVECDEDLQKTFKKILPTWNDDTERFPVRLQDVERNRGLLSAFIWEHYITKWNGFDVYIEELPVEPYDSQEAREWRNLLLNRQLETAYLHPHDFTKKVEGLNSEAGFTSYAEELDVPTVEEYREEIEPSNVSQRGRVFWHVAAPSDLCPE